MTQPFSFRGGLRLLAKVDSNYLTSNWENRCLGIPVLSVLLQQWIPIPLNKHQQHTPVRCDLRNESWLNSNSQEKKNCFSYRILLIDRLPNCWWTTDPIYFLLLKRCEWPLPESVRLSYLLSSGKTDSQVQTKVI